MGTDKTRGIADAEILLKLRAWLSPLHFPKAALLDCLTYRSS